MTQMIMVHGGNKQTPQWCKRAGWDYGVQFGYAIYGKPVMFDYVVGGWHSYLATLRQYRPALAIAGDFRSPDEYDEMIARAVDIWLLGITPILVAKFNGAAEMIPLSCRVGVSVPTAHMNDGYIPRNYEVEGRSLHLLGGHPDQWKWCMAYYRHARIDSIDGNNAHVQARDYGKLWSRYGYYKELRGRGFDVDALTVASMRNAVRYLSNCITPEPASDRVLRCRIQAGVVATTLEMFAAR